MQSVLNSKVKAARLGALVAKQDTIFKTFHLTTKRDFDRNSSISSNTQKDTPNFRMAQPKLVVFDLDYTLWPFWVDTHVDPPFTMGSDGKVYDARKAHIKYYRDVPDILARLHKEGFMLGIASRTSAPKEAGDLTRLFNWDQFFHYRQIYPGCKITHFKKLQEQSGVEYRDMIFFDDEHRNIVDVSSLGVTCILVPDGVSHESFQQGIKTFQSRRKDESNRQT